MSREDIQALVAFTVAAGPGGQITVTCGQCGNSTTSTGALNEITQWADAHQDACGGARS
jgi:hypothetical protein